MNDTIGGLPIDEEAARVLSRILADFGPPVDQTGGFSIVRVNQYLPLVGLARLPLERQGFRARGPSDKTRWELDGTFRGVEVALADMLYGPRMLVSECYDGDPTSLATDAARSLAKACELIERRVFAPFAASQATDGNVTMLNLSHRLYGGYQFFRWHGQGLIDGHGDNETRVALIRQASAAAGTELPMPWFVASNVGFCVTAMTTAWFSWLEHVLVLMLPFGAWNPAEVTIQRVIGDTWADKWKRVVGIEKPESKKTFDSLAKVAEEYRNRDAHGGFGKGDAGLLVHTPAGVMPARLSAGLDHIISGALPSSVDGLAAVVAVLDQAETFLRTGPTRHAMAWIDEGLDVAFDAQTRGEVRAAMCAGDAEFEHAVERWSMLQDRANNYEF